MDLPNTFLVQYIMSDKVVIVIIEKKKALLGTCYVSYKNVHIHLYNNHVVESKVLVCALFLNVHVIH